MKLTISHKHWAKTNYFHFNLISPLVIAFISGIIAL
uniref:Uncharacterized protein n=1 Tax=Raoultella planticola TaxID=575 RepID=W8CUE3_RAOPL|nr:hypothetical protein pKpNDM1_00066 [Raoultella planticola]